MEQQHPQQYTPQPALPALQPSTQPTLTPTPLLSPQSLTPPQPPPHWAASCGGFPLPPATIVGFVDPHSHQSQSAPASINDALRGVGQVLLNAIGEGVGLFTRTGDLLWVNDFIAALPGSLRERFAAAARNFDRAHPLPPRSIVLPPNYLPPRDTVSMAEEDRHYEVTLLPLPAAAAATGLQADALVLVVADVSSTKRLQQKIAAIDQAGADLMRLDAEVVRKYNAMERLELLEGRIIKVAASLLHFDHFAIRLLDEKADKLVLVIKHNVPPEYDAFILRPRLEKNGITGHVAASGLSYLCNDIRQDPLYIQGVEGAQSSLTIPLRVNDKVIGVMNVESKDLAAFTEEDRQLGEIFARYVAMALNMLDLLVVERIVTNQTITVRVSHELDEPLQDIAHQVDLLLVHDPADAYVKEHLKKISEDLVAIRTRMKDCAAGPQSLLDVDKAMADRALEPVLVGKRVLVADDHPNIRRLIGDYLSMKGGILTVFDNGKDAINALTSLCDTEGRFDIVISDIHMPDATGYEVFAAARAHCPDVPVVLMTGFGYDPHHSIVRAHEDGLQGVLFKPFQLQKLIETVRKAFGVAT